MKLSIPTLLFAALVAVLTISTAADQSHEFHQQIQAILINAPRDMDGTEAQFFDDALRDAYNSLHDPNNVYLDEVAVVSQKRHGQPTTSTAKDAVITNTSLHGPLGWRFWWDYQIIYVSVGGQCRFCWDDPNLMDRQGKRDEPLEDDTPYLLHAIEGSAHLQNLNPAVVHRLFEQKLYDILTQGPHDYFRQIEDCLVDFANNDTAKNVMPPLLHSQDDSDMDDENPHQHVTQQVETVLVNTPRTMVHPDIRTYFDNAWMEAYNEMHDPNEIYIESVHIDAQEYHQDGQRKRLRGTICSTCFHWNLQFVYVKVDGNCGGCRTDGTLYDEGIPPLGLAIQAWAVRSGLEPAVVHRQFELNLCRKLRGSPFAFFAKLEECLVNLAPPKDGIVESQQATATTA